MSTVREYYVVDHDLWERYVGWRELGVNEVVGPGAVHLCIGCLEHRMGRRLTPADFLPCPANTDDADRTPRLRDRLGRWA